MARIKAPARKGPTHRQGKRHAAPKKKAARRAAAPPVTTPAPSPVRTLTRGAVAKRLGVSIATVRRLEASGKLKPTVDENDVRHFSEEEIESLGSAKPETTRIDPGERAARAWDQLAKGASVFDLVTTLRMHPDEATKLAEKFAAPGVLVIPPAVAGELAALGFGDASGRVSAATLVAAARTLRARLRQLRQAEEERRAPASTAPPLPPPPQAAPTVAAATRPAPSGRSPRDRSPRARATR